MSQKKMVSRKVAIGLGIVCILLIAGLGGAMAYYTMTVNNKDGQLNTLKSEIASVTGGSGTANVTAEVDQLNATINQLNGIITQLQTWLNGNVTAYQNEVSLYNNEVTLYDNEVNQCNSLTSENTNLNNIISLSDSQSVASDQTVEQGNSAYSDFYLQASYAGYVVVYVQYSTVSGTWVDVSWTSNGVSYSQEITVSAGYSAVFPVLPSSVTIGVGNGLVWPSNGASETVTITFYY